MSVTACPCVGVGVTRPVDVRLGVPHCTTCHKEWHFACEVCGKCLPGWIPPSPSHQWRAGDRRVRIDRRTCSNACRQKAYRARRRERAL
jgi:hypothetical protein